MEHGQQYWESTWREYIFSHKPGLKAYGVRALLRIASWPYGWTMQIRNWLYDHRWFPIHAAAVPVVSVGNLSMGGTGKTPCIEYIARYYRQRDIRVTILSRGYGSQGARNDEALVLEENLPDVPHLQNADRVAAAECAVQELDSQLLLLDDGFQHRRLHRDLDIVLIDATRPPTEDALFPRGTLREPLSALSRADHLILTRTDQASPMIMDNLGRTLARRFPRLPVAQAIHQPKSLICGDEVVPPQALEQRTIAAFCGLGQPQAFRRTLEQLGARLLDFRTYPDHHPYTRADVEGLHRWAAATPPGTWIVTTRKDWVKLRLDNLGGRSLWTLTVTWVLSEGVDAFHSALDGVAELILEGSTPDTISEEICGLDTPISRPVAAYRDDPQNSARQGCNPST
jgi:tetraacyldisaccharide 4'-kinase